MDTVFSAQVPISHGGERHLRRKGEAETTVARRRPKKTATAECSRSPCIHTIVPPLLGPRSTDKSKSKGSLAFAPSAEVNEVTISLAGGLPQAVTVDGELARTSTWTWAGAVGAAADCPRLDGGVLLHSAKRAGNASRECALACAFICMLACILSCIADSEAAVSDPDGDGHVDTFESHDGEAPRVQSPALFPTRRARPSPFPPLP
mmetsp:Transcript_41795/g.87481  ORF Transcript_41795/g.87481 Transcript_41795/m.87481 type:complete len:206 (-) Transcript_41795:671-1288(-)